MLKMADVDGRRSGDNDQSDSGSQPSAEQQATMGTSWKHRRPSLEGLERVLTVNLTGVPQFRQHFDVSVVRRVRMAHLARRDWRVRVLLLLEEPASSCVAQAWAWVLAALVLTSCGLLLLLTSSLAEDQTRHLIAVDRACSVTICADWALRAVLYLSLAIRSPMSSEGSFSFSGAGGAKEVLGGGRNLIWLLVDMVASSPLIIFAIQWPSTDVQLGLCARAACELVASLRLCRLISIARHSNGSHILVDVLSESIPTLMVPFYMLCVSSLFFGVSLHYLEREYAGDSSHIASIADGVYFMWVTFSTVGYGDISPISEPGKIVTLLAITVGLLFFAMPLSIVGQSFANAMELRNMRLVVVAFQEDLLSRRMGPHGLRQTFDEIDVDGSGELDEAEFAAFLKSNSNLRRLSPSQIHAIFTKLDSDRDGAVSYAEVSRAVFPNLDVFDHGSGPSPPEPSASPSPTKRRTGHDVLSAAGAEVMQGKETEAASTEQPPTEGESSATRGGGGGAGGADERGHKQNGGSMGVCISDGGSVSRGGASSGGGTAGGNSFARRVRRVAAVVDDLTAPPTPFQLTPDTSGRVTPTGGVGDVPYMSRLLGYLPGSSYAGVAPHHARKGGYDGYGGPGVVDTASFRRQRRRRAATSDAVGMASTTHDAHRQVERSCVAEDIAEGRVGGSSEGSRSATPPRQVDSGGVAPIATHPGRLAEPAERRRARSGDRIQFAPNTYYAARDGRLKESGGVGDASGGAAAALQEVRADVKRLETQMEALAAQVSLVLKAVQRS